jgi:hypothetical protein
MALAYLIVVTGGLRVIEFRHLRDAERRTWADRIPFMVGAYYKTFCPERLKLVACAKMTTNHCLQLTDIQRHSKLPKALYSYGTNPNLVVGKYLIKEVQAGEMIDEEALKDKPVVNVVSNSVLLLVRIPAFDNFVEIENAHIQIQFSNRVSTGVVVALPVQSKQAGGTTAAGASAPTTAPPAKDEQKK